MWDWGVIFVSLFLIISLEYIKILIVVQWQISNFISQVYPSNAPNISTLNNVTSPYSYVLKLLHILSLGTIWYMIISLYYSVL